MSSSMELDPLFLKGLRLLHSHAKESADQLRQLLDDVLAQRHISTSSSLPRQEKIKQESDGKPIVTKRVSPKHYTSPETKFILEDTKRRESEKRPLERLKHELSDLGAEVHPSKRSYPDSSSSSPSPQPLITKSELDPSVYQDAVDSDTSEETTDAEGFAIQMGLTCLICKQLDVNPRNQLIECQECHSLYHQECHRPPVTEQEVNDPRHVWYCAKCTKTMKKVTTKVQQKQCIKTTIPGIPVLAIAKETVNTMKVVKHEAPSLLPFKRTEVKAQLAAGTFCSTSVANKPTGLAGLAANLGARPGMTGSTASHSNKSSFGLPKSTPSLLSSKLPFPALASLSTKQGPPVQSPSKSLGSGGSGGGSGGGGLASLASAVTSKANKHSSGSLLRNLPSGTSTSGNGGNGSSVGSKTAVSSSLMSADKRLQIMKKKAAAKMQEKRRLSSK